MEQHVLDITRTILGEPTLEFLGEGIIGAVVRDEAHYYAKMNVTTRDDSTIYEVVDNRHEEPLFTVTTY